MRYRSIQEISPNFGTEALSSGHVSVDANSDTWNEAGVDVDRDGNSSGNIEGFEIHAGNSGSGSVTALRLTDVKSGGTVFMVPTDATSIATSSTDSAGRIKIKDASGNVRYIPYFT